MVGKTAPIRTMKSGNIEPDEYLDSECYFGAQGTASMGSNLGTAQRRVENVEF